MNKKEATVDFYNQKSRQYYEEWKDNLSLLPLLKGLIAELPIEPRILDVGCGPGVEAKRLVELGAAVTGIDLSDESLLLARRHVPEGLFTKMDIQDLRFPACSFDAVLDSAALFHFSDDEQVKILSSIKNLLKNNGRLLSIYQTGDFSGLQTRLYEGKELSRYVNLKSLDAWMDTIVSAGFATAKKLGFAQLNFRAAICVK